MAWFVHLKCCLAHFSRAYSCTYLFASWINTIVTAADSKTTQLTNLDRHLPRFWPTAKAPICFCYSGAVDNSPRLQLVVYSASGCDVWLIRSEIIHTMYRDYWVRSMNNLWSDHSDNIVACVPHYASNTKTKHCLWIHYTSAIAPLCSCCSQVGFSIMYFHVLCVSLSNQHTLHVYLLYPQCYLV